MFVTVDLEDYYKYTDFHFIVLNSSFSSHNSSLILYLSLSLVYLGLISESKPEMDSRQAAVTLHPSKFNIFSLCKPAKHDENEDIMIAV